MSYKLDLCFRDVLSMRNCGIHVLFLPEDFPNKMKTQPIVQFVDRCSFGIWQFSRRFTSKANVTLTTIRRRRVEKWSWNVQIARFSLETLINRLRVDSTQKSWILWHNLHNVCHTYAIEICVFTAQRWRKLRQPLMLVEIVNVSMGNENQNSLLN